MSKKSRVKTPIFLQMEKYECGAAALGIILSYYKFFVPLSELRETCCVTTQGTHLRNIIAASRYYGLEAKLKLMTAEESLNATYPAIGYWKKKHFVVLEGSKKNKVFINDPERGHVTITREEFSIHFSQIVIFFELTPKFKKRKNKNGLFKFVKEILLKNRNTLFFITSLSLILSGLSLLTVEYSRLFMKYYFSNKAENGLSLLISAVSITLGVRFFLTLLHQRIQYKLNAKMASQMSYKTISHLLLLPIAFFDLRKIEKVISSVRAGNTIAFAICNLSNAILVGGIQIVVFITYLFFYNWRLSAVISLIFTIEAFLFFWIFHFSEKHHINMRNSSESLASYSKSSIGIIETIKAFGQEKKIYELYLNKLKENLKNYQFLFKLNTLLTILPSVLQGLITALILGLGAFFVINQSFQLSDVVAFQMLSIILNQVLIGFVMQLNKMRSLNYHVEKIYDILNARLESSYNRIKKITSFEGEVEFDRVSFRFSSNSPVIINNFSFKIPAGKSVGIIGASGAGKSTIGYLLARFYPVTQGRIMIDNININEIHKNDFVHCLSIVSQECHIFQGTLKENLTFYKKNIKENDIVNICKLLGIWEDICNKKQGLNMNLSDEGKNINTGFKKLIEVARALLMKPKILLLDEVTAELDPLREMRLMQALQNLECTKIIISRQLRTLRNIDNIIAIKNGEIFKTGSYIDFSSENIDYK